LVTAPGRVPSRSAGTGLFFLAESLIPLYFTLGYTEYEIIFHTFARSFSGHFSLKH
jgi:hypothetical protein